MEINRWLGRNSINATAGIFPCRGERGRMAAWKPGADAGACGAGILGLAGLPSGGYNRRRWEKTIQMGIFQADITGGIVRFAGIGRQLPSCDWVSSQAGSPGMRCMMETS